MLIESTNGPELQLGTEIQRVLLGRYEIVEPVGKGAMATVYLANQVNPARQVAIKVLDPEVANRLTRRRFLREVEVVSGLHHPRIVPILAAGDEDELLYYVMPFVKGETLRQRIVRERFIELEDALSIACDVADALEYAHANGVIHRDVKPENILLSEDHALVTDFGVARAMTCAECGEETQALTTAGLPIGTPLYMSPEQALGDPEMDGRTDIYSLGCVLYEMLTGRVPFSGRTVYEIMSAHTNDPVPALRTPLTYIPRPLRKAVSRAMAKRPDHRFETAGEFRSALTGAPVPDVGNAGVRAAVVWGVLGVVAALAALSLLLAP